MAALMQPSLNTAVTTHALLERSVQQASHHVVSEPFLLLQPSTVSVIGLNLIFATCVLYIFNRVCDWFELNICNLQLASFVSSKRRSTLPFCEFQCRHLTDNYKYMQAICPAGKFSDLPYLNTVCNMCPIGMAFGPTPQRSIHVK
jgi:hypothetical protein